MENVTGVDPIPQHLIDEIAAGRCVAFVGAGFSAPAVPAWKGLLEGLAEKAALDDDSRTWLGELIGHGGARDLEAAAQVLQVAMGPDFDPTLAEVLVERGHPERIAERRQLLAGIPFDAILTTNFDHFLVGDVPGPDAYQRILRDPAHRWWEPRFWSGEEGAPVLKLHGEVGPVGDDVVFTQRDYRERLYSSPAYMTFLRSLFATSTVLFLGVSFTDTYLNELRSEVLAMLDHRTDDLPVAYAVLNDVKPHQQRYLSHHEGPTCSARSSACWAEQPGARGRGRRSPAGSPAAAADRPEPRIGSRHGDPLDPRLRRRRPALARALLGAGARLRDRARLRRARLRLDHRPGGHRAGHLLPPGAGAEDLQEPGARRHPAGRSAALGSG